MWATRRRIEIIGIIIAAILVFIVLPYWITHREIPTCTDGKQNQKEEGVDCGGPCTLLCTSSVKELNILWTKVFTIRPGQYDLVAYVENPNFEAALPEFSYTAKLFDEDGTEIATQDGTAYARPSERFVIFVGPIDVGARVARSGSIAFSPEFRWMKAASPLKPFSVSDRVLKGADRTPELTALLHNETTETYRNIDVAAVIYDSKNNPIGVSSTKVEKLDPKGVGNLIFTWPGAFDYVAETEQCATPVDVILAIDRSGSMRDENKLEQAKIAAERFVDRLTPQDLGGFITFASEASNPIDQPLTDAMDRIKRVVQRTEIRTDGMQFTNIGDALRGSVNEFATMRHNTEARPIIVLLTDGIPNRPLDENGKGTEVFASAYAKKIAEEAKAEDITIYTIGLGSDVNAELLTVIASTPDHYYPAVSGADLAQIYQQIATAMCKKAPSIIEVIPRVNDISPLLPAY